MIDWWIVKSYYYVQNILKSCSVTGKLFFCRAKELIEDHLATWYFPFRREWIIREYILG